MEYRINLEPELDAYLQRKLKDGQYTSVDEAIRDALRRVVQTEQLDDDLRESLRQADAGDTIDIDEVFGQLNRELAALEKHRTA